MFVIPDEILEGLLCFTCHKYLSAKPVKVYPNRGIKCGRCCGPEDAGVLSYFGLVADQALFPCINHLDGCNKLLTYSEVIPHEKLCLAKKYDCPICVELNATAYDMYLHFKQTHPNSLLKSKSELIVDVGQELYQSYMYRKGNLLFFIALQYIQSEQIFAFSASHLGIPEQCSKALQSFELSTLNGKIKLKSPKSECGWAAGNVVKWLQVKLVEDEFPKSVVVCRFAVNTKEIEQLVVLSSNVKKDFWAIKTENSTVVTSSESTAPFPSMNFSNFNFNNLSIPTELGRVTTAESSSVLSVTTCTSDSTKNIFDTPIPTSINNAFQNANAINITKKAIPSGQTKSASKFSIPSLKRQSSESWVFTQGPWVVDDDE